MTVYVICGECSDVVPEAEFTAHVCDDELPGYDPNEPWMDDE